MCRWHQLTKVKHNKHMQKKMYRMNTNQLKLTVNDRRK